MIKRIKAKVKQTKRVPDEYAIEVYYKGRFLTIFSMPDKKGNYYFVRNIRYKGKLYFVVFVHTRSGEKIIKECIEL